MISDGRSDRRDPAAIRRLILELFEVIMSHRSFRLVSLAVAFAAIVASCSSAGEPASESSALAIDASNPFVEAGISITSIDDPVAGPGLTLTDWQSANLLRDADAGQGLTGAQLRSEIPMPDDEMPLDLMLGAWVLDGASPVAEIAQGLMPTLDFDDPTDVTFPTAVVVLFTYEATLADADGNAPQTLPAAPVVVAPFTAEQFEAASAARGPQGFASPLQTPGALDASLGVPSELRSTLADNPCGALLAFHDKVLGLVYDALGGKDSWLGQKAQVAIGLLPKAATPYAIPGKGTFDMLTTLGFIAGLVGSVSPWTVTIEANEDPIAYGVAPGVGQRGTVRTVVDPGLQVKWPAALKSCAQVLGIDLPEITPVGGIVTWTPTFGTHATKLSEDGVIMEIDGRYEATLLYDTTVESADQAAKGQPTSSGLVFEARVDRPGNETFDKLISKIIERFAGDGVIGSALKYLTAGVATTIKEMSDPPPTAAIVTVTFHDPPPDPVTTTASTPASVPEPPTASGACIGIDLVSQPMAAASTGVRLRMEPTGSLVFDFGSSAPYSVDDGFGNSSTITLAGSVTGTYSGSDDSYTTTMSKINLSGTVEVLGNIVALPPEAFTGAAADPQLGTTSEILTCSDGAITIARTGQVFS